MGEARAVMDRMTEAMVGDDMEALASLYAVDALAETPELGQIKGREQIIEYLKGFSEAFSDKRYEMVIAHEAGNVAIDEGYLHGVHTGPLMTPSGEVVEPTGRTLRLRSCDIGTVEHGLITRHHFFYDQLDFLTQLGLLPDDGS
jgi:hypothetical protein